VPHGRATHFFLGERDAACWVQAKTYRCPYARRLAGVRRLVDGQVRLADRVEVAQERLAIHLLLASLTFAALVWLAASLKRREAEIAAPVLPGSNGLRQARSCSCCCKSARGSCRGLARGRAYNTWPLIDGYFLPPLDQLTLFSPLWRNVLDNILMVQFQHRMTAYALLALALIQALYTSRVAAGSRAERRAFAVAGS